MRYAICNETFADWTLENVLSVLAVVVIVAWRRRLVFSRVSYTLIFIFLSLHTLGAHYTYAEVPYQQWFPALAGGAPAAP